MPSNVSIIRSSSLTIPSHLYPHTEVQINDNTIRRYVRDSIDRCKILAVFMSPKGEDRVMRTITGGLEEFDDVFGAGPYSIYGQPLLNARAAANTGLVTLQCMRITAEDATYSNQVVWVQYKATAKVMSTTNPDEVVSDGKLQLRFVTSPLKNVTKIQDFYEAFDLLCKYPTGVMPNPMDRTENIPVSVSDSDIVVTVPDVDTDDGWEQLPFMAVISKGRGSYGDSYSFRISNNPRSDKTVSFKNYYFRVFEGTRTVDTPTRVALTDEAIINNKSLYFEAVVNGLENGVSGSDNVRMKVNSDVLPILYETYTDESMYPDAPITMYQFDPILGINVKKELAKSAEYTKYADIVKSSSGLDGLEIVSDSGSVQFNTMTGIKLAGGSDGSFAVSSDPERMEARRVAIRNAYYWAFAGNELSEAKGYDRNIMSPTRFPLDAVFDADFPLGEDGATAVNELSTPADIAKVSLKGALASLVERRHEDCFCFMDLGTDRTSMLDPDPGTETGFYDKRSAYEYASELNDIADWWTYSIDAYYGKIRDPYNKKIVTVTSTYNLIVNYPKHWELYGGKHIPYAGSKYGVIDQFIPNTIFPIFDVDIDEEHLDMLVDRRVNYAQINSKQEIIRGTQGTRYPKDELTGDFDALLISNLSEINNALIVLDIKKDAIKLVENYAYNFNESDQIALFNRDAEELVQKYAAAQVKSISASFSRTDEEAELGILHLTITVVHKALVKINLIDINVERAVQS